MEVKSIAPRAAFGFDSTPLVALDHSSLTYIFCCGSRVALASANTDGKSCTQSCSRRVQFFPPVQVQGSTARVVTAVAFHNKRNFLALCITQSPQHHRPGIVIYSLALFNRVWVPTILDTLICDISDARDEFGLVAFSTDASIIVAITKAPLQMVVGFQRESGMLEFATSFHMQVENVAFHPSDALELSTSGPEHIQLWHSIRTNLNPRNSVKYLSCLGANYTLHSWLASEMLVAGTNCGDIMIIQQTPSQRKS